MPGMRRPGPHLSTPNDVAPIAPNNICSDCPIATHQAGLGATSLTANSGAVPTGYADTALLAQQQAFRCLKTCSAYHLPGGATSVPANKAGPPCGARLDDERDSLRGEVPTLSPPGSHLKIAPRRSRRHEPIG
jgi:hypothetical protein